jgi:hypothetical protein
VAILGLAFFTPGSSFLIYKRAKARLFCQHGFFMRENATIFVYEYPCPDGLLARDLAKYLPLGKYTTGIVPIPFTHPLSDETRKRIYWLGNKSSRLIFADCCMDKFDIIELASYYEQIIICDHHNKAKFRGFVWPENVIPYIDESMCGAENFFYNVLLPVCPDLKRPLVLDIVRIADLAIRDPKVIVSLLGQDKVKALALKNLDDLSYILVSSLDTSINYAHPDKALIDLERFQVKSLKDIVEKGIDEYPRLKAEAKQLLSNPDYIPLDLPGIGPVWAPFVKKDIHENRFVANDAPEYGDLFFIGCKRNGYYYLSIRTKIQDRTEDTPDAEIIARYLSTMTFRVKNNGREVLVRGIKGGGRNTSACGQFDPKVARLLLSLPAVKEGDPRLKVSPLLYAVARQDRVVRELLEENASLLGPVPPVTRPTSLVAETHHY